jgi:hypothetical protein
LAVLERAHGNHDEAEHFCSLANKHEIDWDGIEKRTRNLANAEHEPKTSEMFAVLAGLRAARKALFRDFLGCSIKNDETRMALVQDAMESIDGATEEVEKSIQNRVQWLEGVIEYKKQAPAK